MYTNKTKIYICSVDDLLTTKGFLHRNELLSKSIFKVNTFFQTQ